MTLELGKVSFVTATKTKEYLDYLEKGKLAGTKCKSCGALHFPPRADCDQCMSSDVEWMDMESKGKIVTYTTIHVGPTGFEDVVPYTICMVELEGGGRLLGWLDEAKEEDISVGQDVSVVLKELEGDRVIYAIRL
ncbi:MAG: Zn-ribbon domain-containing OB-fold protein [Methanomassiliicoccales archaeon]|nr:MAG: Zn-ribbon domain-containing OB-fold protein [Methanomassiliicoccales archaeon]